MAARSTSPFTAALLKNMNQSVDVRVMFRQVVADVLKTPQVIANPLSSLVHFSARGPVPCFGLKTRGRRKREVHKSKAFLSEQRLAGKHRVTHIAEKQRHTRLHT